MIDGTYFAMLPAPDGRRAHTFTLHEHSGTLTGTVTNTRGAEPIFNGSCEGSHLSFQVHGAAGDMRFDGTADEGGLDLTWTVGDEAFHIRADRA